MWWDSPLPPRSFLLYEMTPQPSVSLCHRINNWPPLMVLSGSRCVTNLEKACCAVGFIRWVGIAGAIRRTGAKAMKELCLCGGQYQEMVSLCG